MRFYISPWIYETFGDSFKMGGGAEGPSAITCITNCGTLGGGGVELSTPFTNKVGSVSLLVDGSFVRMIKLGKYPFLKEFVEVICLIFGRCLTLSIKSLFVPLLNILKGNGSSRLRW